MKNSIKFGVAGLVFSLALVFFPGCAHLSMSTETPMVLTNGAVGVKTAKGSVSTGFQSTTALDKLRVANGVWNGERQSLGVDSVSQTSDAGKFTEIFGQVLLKGLAAYMTGGASTVIPSGGSSSVILTNTFVDASGTRLPMVDHVVLKADGTVLVCFDSAEKTCLILYTNSVVKR